MMKFLRSQSQTVLVVVLGVIGLGFLFYGNAGNLLTSGASRPNTDFGRIDGEDVSMNELTDAIRNTRDWQIIIGHGDQLNQPGVSRQIADLAWSQLLLLREADRLHIDISDKELVDYVHNMPLFQKDGVYSPEVYENVMKALAARFRMSSDAGVDPVANTKALFETILRNELRSDAVSNALFTGVRGSAHDVSTQYEKFYGPTTVSLVTFDPKSSVTQAPVAEADIEAEYKAHPENPAYRTKEKRKVDYVLFLLSPDQAKLPDAQKAAAKNDLGQKALDFALAFQPEPAAGSDNATPPPPPDFMAEAKKRNLSPATTDFFADDTPPANLPPSASFNSAAFSLTKDNAISKVVELDNGVAVLHLVEIQPSDLRPLTEVKADITKKLQQDQGLRNAQVTSELTTKLLQSAVAKGADFKTTAAGMKLKVETLAPFVPYTTIRSTTGDERLRTIAYASTSLAPGQVSDPIPLQAQGTTMVLHLDSRAPADPAGLADFETRFRQSQDEQLQAAVRFDWANWKSKQPGTHKPPELDAYGTVE